MEDTKKAKSRPHPTKSWNDCRDMIYTFAKLGPKSSFEDLAKALNTTVTSRLFRPLLSSARQFGMVDLSGDTVVQTPLAKDLLFNDSFELRLQSFRSPKIYDEIFQKYEGSALPSGDKFAMLLAQMGILGKASNDAAAIFIESANQLGLIKNGILDISNTEIPKSELAETDKLEEKHEDELIVATITADKTQPDNERYHQFEIPTTIAGKTAKIAIPTGLSDTDLDFLSLAFNSLVKAFIDNLKAHNATPAENTLTTNANEN
ncbi:MAG: hypothetical protein LBM59_03055 [Ruminococcus sp.]|jgi:hypothetical protein|nr:hypothetical protein [Ruminococcus sp.]